MMSHNDDSRRLLANSLHSHFFCLLLVPPPHVFEQGSHGSQSGLNSHSGGHSTSVLQSSSSLGSPSHWPLFSQRFGGYPSGQLHSRSRDFLPPPHVAEHSDQHVHGEYSHFGGQASEKRILFPVVVK